MGRFAFRSRRSVFHSSVRWCVRQALLPYWQPQTAGLEHIPKSGPVLIAANHPTIIDPLFLVSLFPRQLDVMMSQEVRRIPLAGRLFYECGHIPTGPSCLQDATERLKQGSAIGIFPEGKHSYSDILGEFRKGVSVLAQTSGAPVLPVAILGNQHYLSARAPWMGGGPVQVRVGPPLICRDQESIEDFTCRLHQAVQEQMRSLQSAPRLWKPNWRFTLAKAFWVPVTRALFAVVDRIKPNKIR